MSKNIKLKKGFNINLAGKAALKLVEGVQPETFAIKPTDFLGLTRAKLLVKEGDMVKAGTPLFFDKGLESVLYVAPVSGEVTEVKRGEKRKILEVKIRADKEIQYETYQKSSVSELKNLSRETIVESLTQRGAWPNIIQRPYGIVADPSDTPKAIFISSFDTNPLAADIDFCLKGEEKYIEAGILVLKKLTKGAVNLGVSTDSEVSSLFSNAEGVTVNKFSGPHPAGNVGVQIHHIDPINKGDLVWTISPYGVSQIGKLFIEGHYDASKVIAVCGSEVKEPAYYKTFIGANTESFLKDNLKQENVRVISGNVLTGEKVGSIGYLGYYHNQVTVIPEGDYAEFLGWILPSSKKLSFHRAFGLLSFLNGKKEYVVDTNTHGEERAFVQSGAFESVTPMDILPTYLLKAIMAEDFENIEALGIYEVIEEDLALCEFIDVSKHPVQALLREGLDLIKNS